MEVGGAGVVEEIAEVIGEETVEEIAVAAGVAIEVEVIEVEAIVADEWNGKSTKGAMCTEVLFLYSCS
jgi:hypothetical protein